MTAWIEYKGFDESQYKFAPWVWCLIALYFLIPVFFYMLLPSVSSNYNRRLKINKRQAVVCVLGDLGHSPRMLYHTRSLLSHGYNVKLCGYLESELSEDLLDNDDVDVYDIPVLKNVHNLPYIIFALYKVIHQVFSLSSLLFEVMQSSRFIILQNPPSVPLLLLTVLLKKYWFKNCLLILDWHNLNYSILNLRFKNLNHPVVKAVKFYEQTLGRHADLNITVTHEMARFLKQELGIQRKNRIVTLYDKAPAKFQPVTSEQERLDIIASQPEIFSGSNHHFTFDPSKDKIVVSSTSFSEDEDFGILLDALRLVDQEKNSPNILLIVTGKGPLRDVFVKNVEDAALTKVIVKNVWVSNEFYPKLLSVADLGISLHVSSSGIDLPMKIVDFFGCGVPVISLNFKAIGELVENNVNGLIVDNCIQLSNALIELLSNSKKLAQLKQGALLKTEERWEDNWNDKFGNLVDS